MTAGRMNCLGAIPRRCLNTHGETEKRWSSELESLLRVALPDCNVNVHTGLDSDAFARASVYGMRVITAAQQNTFMKLVDRRDDLVIEDYSVNDVRGWVPGEYKKIAAGFETFVRNTKTLLPADETHADGSHAAGPRYGPQMVHMESFARFEPATAACEYKNLHRACNPPPKCLDASEPVHLNVARHYNIPVVSFMLGTCAYAEAGSSEPARRLWRASCLGVDRPGNDCEMHPGPTTHRVYALLLAHYVVSQAIAAAAEEAADDRAAHEEAPLHASKGEVQAMRSLPGYALRDLVIPPPGEAGPTLMQDFELSYFIGCDKPRAVMDVSSTCNPKPLFHITTTLKPQEVRGWRCFEDVPSKPGWISIVEQESAAAATREIEFRMVLSRRGTVTAGFLRSYTADMGKASIFLKGLPQYAVELDGAWESLTSQADLNVIRVHRLLPRSNESSVDEVEGVKAKEGSWHTVVVRALPPPPGTTMSNASSGVMPRSKFKLLSLATC